MSESSARSGAANELCGATEGDFRKVDLDLGGSPLQAWVLGAASVALIGAFVLRLRQLGYVLGRVSVATEPLSCCVP